MSNQEFHGAFVFRNQGYGILSSTYFNNSDPKPYPESAILKTGLDERDPFIRTFETFWLEKNNEAHVKLIIKSKTSHKGIYDLVWTKDKNSDIAAWEGLGMIENGILMGCYWKAKNETV